VVSVILNLSDGMLSDFLKIQIICTVNCRVTEIDQALLRPGRLTCHRVFPRLSYAEAEKLAVRLGKRLPESEDYSLAEIFAGSPAAQASRSRIGFAG
jgi:ATP-dependent 26S proteasome regulatory subunit